MNFNINKTIKKAFFDFIVANRISNPVAITCTLKQANSIKTKGGDFIYKPDRIDFETNTRFFLNRLNQQTYGRRFTKYKKRLSVVPVFEGTKSIRTHLHFVMERPEHIQFSDFRTLLKECWKKTPLGYQNFDLKEIDNYEGWINYMLKNKSKNIDLQSSIDVGNLYLN